MSRMGFFTFLVLFSIPALGKWISYEVQKSETLSDIAIKTLPDQSLWGPLGSVTLIFEKNKDTIKNKDLIFAGQDILVPAPKMEITKEAPEEKPRKPAAAEVPTETLVKEERPATVVVALHSSLIDKSLEDKTSGATGTLRSKPTWGIGVESLFPVSQRWDLGVGLIYEYISFAESSTRTLQVESKNFVHFHLAVRRVFENSFFEVGVQYGQTPLVTGVDSTTIGVSTFNVLSPYLREKWIFRRYGKTNVAVEAKFSSFLPSSNESYRLEHGWAGELSLPLTRTFYGVTPFIEYGKRETNTVKHTDIVGGVRTRVILSY